MKFLSLIVLLILVSWSWAYIHQTADIAEQTHIDIQEDLTRFITNYISEQLPNSRNIRFEKMWTSRTKSEQLKASFRYSFEDVDAEDGSARVEIEGYALLNRKEGENPDLDTWSFDELHILDNVIEFTEGLNITPGADTEEATKESE